MDFKYNCVDLKKYGKKRQEKKCASSTASHCYAMFLYTYFWCDDDVDVDVLCWRDKHKLKLALLPTSYYYYDYDYDAIIIHLVRALNKLFIQQARTAILFIHSLKPCIYNNKPCLNGSKTRLQQRYCKKKKMFVHFC